MRVRYEDERGVVQTIEAAGPFAELLQHEIDHLDGILAIDRALDRNSLYTRVEFERQYRAGELKGPAPSATSLSGAASNKL